MILFRMHGLMVVNSPTILYTMYTRFWKYTVVTVVRLSTLKVDFNQLRVDGFVIDK